MKWFSIFILFGLGLGLSSCGKTTQLVSALATPSRPFVLNQDFAIGVPSRTYKANLVQFKLTIKNHHTKTITITGVRFTILNVDGQEKIISLGVDQLLTEVLVSNIKEIQPGELLTGPITDSPIERAKKTKFIFLDGLAQPKSTSKSIRYTIKAQILGWIGSADKPEARLVIAPYIFYTD